jgi:hypothetical protein
VILPNTYGVIQGDPPVLEAAGWYWEKITFDNGINGWVTSYPPYINMLMPPQMIEGSSFNIIADYSGSALTQAICIFDGANSAATLQMQPTTGGVTGTILCPWPKAGTGNHKAVVQAVNQSGTMPSAEFQFQVSAAVVQPIPSAPQNLRIGPASGIATQRSQDAKPASPPTTATKPAPPPATK